MAIEWVEIVIMHMLIIPTVVFISTVLYCNVSKKGILWSTTCRAFTIRSILFYLMMIIGTGGHLNCTSDSDVVHSISTKVTPSS